MLLNSISNYCYQSLSFGKNYKTRLGVPETISATSTIRHYRFLKGKTLKTKELQLYKRMVILKAVTG